VADRGGGGGDYRIDVGWLGALPRLDRPAVMSASQAQDHPHRMRTLAWLETMVGFRHTPSEESPGRGCCRGRSSSLLRRVSTECRFGTRA
jgi:hypothetical protein